MAAAIDRAEVENKALIPIGEGGRLIVSGGCNIAATEVEDVVLAHPSLRECVILAAAARLPRMGAGETTASPAAPKRAAP